MVKIANIRDKKSLEAWLEYQPQAVIVWIAFRAAARVMPASWKAMLTEIGARDANVTALTVLRKLLISAVAAKKPTSEVKSAADAAGDDGIVGVPFTREAEADGAARAAVNAAATKSFTRATDLAGFTASRAASAARDGSAAWQAIRADAEKLERSATLPVTLPLWHSKSPPLTPEWEGICKRVVDQSDAADWKFWIEWYDAQLAGRTMLPDPALTWEMLEKIALIDPAKWDAGPETVNPIIREIWELHRLRAECAALQAEKDAFLATRASEAQRSHNQPPDGLVDDQPEIARHITNVWDRLDEARDELERETPDKSRLRNIAKGLLSALRAIVGYCGKVADTAVMSAAKVGGGAVGTAILDHVVNNGRLMQFAKDLLAFGGG